MTRLSKAIVKKLIKQGRIKVSDSQNTISSSRRLRRFEDSFAFDINYPKSPSIDHQAYLYRALVNIYGRFIEGGEVAWEVTGIISGRRYRPDIAFPNYRLALENDGWEHHGKHLEDFKKDRQKWLLFTAAGWRVIPISLAMVRDDYKNTVDLIDSTIKHCEYQKVNGYFDWRTFYTHIQK